ncbi:MAG TPA: hypothetical protein DD670_06670 [Planctomycetaceae bacterium]|nr:hypothetical protein [Planctomycetaceae bacterium]
MANETESKSTLMHRLRREGRWDAASRFRDVVRRELRAKGLKRAEAREKSWEAMAEQFPPLPESAEQANEVVDEPRIDEAILEKFRHAGPPNLISDVFWVYEHLEDRGVRPGDGPSLGAWTMLCWARRRRNQFIEQLLPRAAALAEETGSETPEDVDPGLPELERYVEEYCRLRSDQTPP